MRKTISGAFLALSLVSTAAIAAAHDFEAGNLVIGHPWSRATPAGAAVGAGYLTIENTGAEADRLTGGSTPIAETVEIHSMSMEGDMMQMRKLDDLPIPAGETVALKPGGYHIMFTGLKQPIEEGEPFTATLTFEKTGDVEIRFDVEPIGAKKPDHGGHGEMQGAEGDTQEGHHHSH